MIECTKLEQELVDATIKATFTCLANDWEKVKGLAQKVSAERRLSVTDKFIADVKAAREKLYATIGIGFNPSGAVLVNAITMQALLNYLRDVENAERKYNS